MPERRFAAVTGASSGVGRAAALALAERRWSLLLLARRGELLDEVAEACTRLGRVEVDTLVADVAALPAAFGEVMAGRAAGTERAALVACAGAANFGNFESQNIAEIVADLEVNVIGFARVLHAALPALRKARAGHVVQVSSVAAQQPLAGCAVYGASKAASLHLTRSVAAEVRREGVRVTSVILGATDTPLWADKDWRPDTADMLAAEGVAEVVRDVLESPLDRSIDEIVLMPPKGVL